MATIIGLRIGSQKTVAIASDGEILLTASGGVSHPSLVSLDSKLRLFGEEASPYFSNNSTYAGLNQILYHSVSCKNKDFPQCERMFNHRDYKFSYENDRLQIHASALVDGSEAREHDGNIAAVSMIGMYIQTLKERALAVYAGHSEHTSHANSKELHFAFAIPPVIDTVYGESTYSGLISGTISGRGLLEACYIAGMDGQKFNGVHCLKHEPSTREGVSMTGHVYNSIDCIVAAYTRRINALEARERRELVGKKAMVFHMGHSSTTVVIVEIKEKEHSPDITTGANNPACLLETELVSYSYNNALGSVDFDETLYNRLLDAMADKYKEKNDINATNIKKGSKRDIRLMLGCERIKKLLSTIPTANVTVENLSESRGDVNFTVTSTEYEEYMKELTAMVHKTVVGTVTGNISVKDIAIIEIFGGGSRMPVVQHVLKAIFPGLTLGAKLEDTSIALGASLLCQKEVVSENECKEEEGRESSAPTFDFTLQELEVEYKRELAYQSTDKDIQLLLKERNLFESFLLETRNIPLDSTCGHIIQGDMRDSLNALLDEYENWFYDVSGEIEPDLLQVTRDKTMALKEAVHSLCKPYFDAKESEKLAKEAELEAAAKLALAEKQAAGEEGEEDHDNRKLKKPERLRMVMKNKEEGTELFKGGNIRPAAARYQKALTHASKFFDLSPDDVVEINTVKVSLYSNLAMCYIKLKNFDNVIRYCTEAIALDPANVKSHFRRSSAWESKREWEKSLQDAQKASNLLKDAGMNEDKMIQQSIDRIRREMHKIKEKEKKMYGKAFA